MTTTATIKAHTAVAISGNKVVAQLVLDGTEKIEDVVTAMRSWNVSVNATVSFENKRGRIVKVVRPSNQKEGAR